MVAFDLVFAPRDHAFTLAGHLDNWVTILESLKAMPGYDTIVIGPARSACSRSPAAVRPPVRGHRRWRCPRSG
jgi:hypothetical protein